MSIPLQHHICIPYATERNVKHRLLMNSDIQLRNSLLEVNFLPIRSSPLIIPSSFFDPDVYYFTIGNNQVPKYPKSTFLFFHTCIEY